MGMCEKVGPALLLACLCYLISCGKAMSPKKKRSGACGEADREAGKQKRPDSGLFVKDTVFPDSMRTSTEPSSDVEPG